MISNVELNPQESSWEYPTELKVAEAGGAKPKDEWVEKLDANSGNYYYYNRTTKETTWDKPADFKPAEKPAAGVSDWASKVDPSSGQVRRRGSGAYTRNSFHTHHNFLTRAPSHLFPSPSTPSQ